MATDISQSPNNQEVPQLVVIGNPENRRIEYFCQAARVLNLRAPEVIAYGDLLNGKRKLSDTLTPQSLLRIESPGENFEVEKKLIVLGAEIGDRSTGISAREANKLEHDHGRIRFLRQWFLGFESLLRDFSNEIGITGCRAFNTPEVIRLMFDKSSCQRHLKAMNISVPEILPLVSNHAELRNTISASGLRRVFIKPLHASSGSGVIAYSMQHGREEIYTSIELVRLKNELRFYNSLKIKRYVNREDTQALVDFILKEGALIEEWIPKASVRGRFFDVRVVVIHGKAKFILPRLSGGPITNLHLGNERGDVDEIRNLMGKQSFERMVQYAEAAVGTINGAFYAGVDVLIPAGFGKPRILEINAFGDLLPGLTYKGFDTYTTVLKDFLHAA